MLFISVLIVGILLSIVNIKSNLLQFLVSVVLVIVLVKLMGGVSIIHSFDTSAYAYMYSLSPDSHRFEAGYMRLSYYFYSHSYTYAQFRYISSAIFMTILYVAVRKFTKNTIFFFTFFSVFPFFVEATQVRNFFMIALVFLGASFLDKKSKTKTLIGSGIIASSALFQISGVIYLLVPIIMWIPTKMLMKICDSLLAIFIVLAVLMHYLSGLSWVSKVLYFVATLSGRSNSEEIVTLYSQGSSFSSVIYYLAAFMFVYLLLRISWVMFFEQNNDFKFSVLFAIFVIGILAVPALSGSADFERFLRNSITASIVIFAEWKINVRIVKKHLLSILINTIVAVVMVTTAWKYWDTTQTGRLQYMPYLVQIYKSDY